MEAGGEAPGFTSGDFRKTLGAFATGVTVVTTTGDEHHYGMTANAFSSLSLDPPLVLVCVRSGAEGMEQLLRNEIFAINVLSAHQEPISRYFASKTRPRGRDAFRDVGHQVGVTGSPIIDEVAAAMDCRLHSVLEAGDHHIFVGEVLTVEVAPEAEPLVFHGGRYRVVDPDT
jgi:flavin reductase (DIM6/NTAB) family NADH-FMN oxidoreductase RutF